MSPTIIAVCVFIYLLIGYIIGIYAALENRAGIPFPQLPKWGKVRRFFLYPVGVYWREIGPPGGILEGDSIVFFATFLWPLRYLPFIQVLGRDIFLLIPIVFIYCVIKAIPKMFGYAMGKVNSKFKCPISDD